ncbi:MAG: nitroreductase family protein [Candidatus Omnitrophota bacterium]|nr:nitroreductase family protein [Candidatus Omnitrophota bacterium]
MMEVMEAIRKRHSIRSYEDREVEEEKLNLILEAGRLAPSAGNRQEWRYVVVRDKQTRQKLMEAAAGQAFVGEAPVVIACCAQTDGHIMKCGQPCYPIDVAISIDHMTLKAVEEGLGTCWVGAFNEVKAREVLGVPDEIRLVELLALGYPTHIPGGKTRKELGEIVKYERWS